MLTDTDVKFGMNMEPIKRVSFVKCLNTIEQIPKTAWFLMMVYSQSEMAQVDLDLFEDAIIQVRYYRIIK